MNSIIEFLKGFILFDGFFAVIMIYSIIQCFLKGFSLSFISFLKWIFSLIITIILVPKLQPWVSEYIESDFINSVGLGIFVFIISLFVMVVIGRSLSRAVTWTGLGSVDKSFGLLFGVFKGYIVSVCLFSIFNWFYPYQNWGISAEDAYSFKIVKKGSKVLIEEFPNSEDFKDTKEKIENI
jgi:membrane protein required for colicin V production